MPRRKQPSIPDELLDQLLAGSDPRAALADGGLLDGLKKDLAERVLNAEFDHHLDGGEPDGRPNGRNGYGAKTVLTSTGKLALQIPRDRLATFDPQLIAKYQRRFPGFDERIVSMYARGMSTRCCRRTSPAAAPTPRTTVTSSPRHRTSCGPPTPPRSSPCRTARSGCSASSSTGTPNSSAGMSARSARASKAPRPSPWQSASSAANSAPAPPAASRCATTTAPTSWPSTSSSRSGSGASPRASPSSPSRRPTASSSASSAPSRSRLCTAASTRPSTKSATPSAPSPPATTPNGSSPRTAT